MLRHRSTLLLTVAITTAGRALAADYAGTYHGDIKGQPSSIELAATPDGYAGTIHLGDTPLPCRAAAQGDHLAGTFASGGGAFPFSATLAGDALTLATGGATYTLTRPPANPLAAAADPAAPAVDATLLASTTTGRAVFLNWPRAHSAADALRATVPLLPKVVGGSATVGDAVADARSQTRGMASFTGTDRAGRPVRGMILCGGGDAGEAASVLYATVDAPAADWATLRAALPQEPLKLHPFDFPDGTGTVGLPDGWTTKSTSLDFGFYATGPDGQSVGYGQSLAVQAPDSELVQITRQNEAMARQLGFRPPPSPPMLIAPFSAPPDALQALFPQFDPILRQTVGYGVRFEKMLDVRDATPNLAGGRAAQMTYTYFKIGPDAEQRLRGVTLAETAPVFGGTWMYCSTDIAAPDDHFDLDGPTMLAIVKSVRPNQQVMLQHQQDRLAAQQQLSDQQRQQQQEQFEQQQKAHREQQDAYDRYNQGWRDRELVTSRSNDDFCEVIRGYRTVYDTRTGDSASVDLNEAQGVADALNTAHGDPDRFVPIPLRDEMHPLNP